MQSRATFHQNVLNVNLPCSYLAGKSQLTQRDWNFQLSCLSFEKRELLCQNVQTAMCFHWLLYVSRHILSLREEAAGKLWALYHLQSTPGSNLAMADQEGNIFSFDELVNIFSYLSPGELSKCSQVCKDWYEASQVGSLWKKHCLQRWNFCHLGKLKPGSCVRNNYFQNGNFLPVFYSLPSLHYSDAQRL